MSELISNSYENEFNNQNFDINGYEFEVLIDRFERYLETTIKLSKFEKFWIDIQETFNNFMKIFEPLIVFNKFIQSEFMNKFINIDYKNEDEIKNDISKCITNEKISIKIGKLSQSIKLLNIYFIERENRYIKLMNKFGEVYVRIRLSRACFQFNYSKMINDIEISKDQYQKYRLFEKYLLESFYNQKLRYPRPNYYCLYLIDKFDALNKFRLEHMNNFFNGIYQTAFNTTFEIINQIFNDSDLFDQIIKEGSKIKNKLTIDYPTWIINKFITDGPNNYERYYTFDGALKIKTDKGFNLKSEYWGYNEFDNSFIIRLNLSSEEDFLNNLKIEISIFQDKKIRYLIAFYNYHLKDPNFSLSLPIADIEEIKSSTNDAYLLNLD